MSRPIAQIARECRTDMMDQGNKSKGAGYNWRNKFYAAVPYLDAMLTLNSINDMYYADTARSCVLYFLANAQQWRGEKARALKGELNALLKE